MCVFLFPLLLQSKCYVINLLLRHCCPPWLSQPLDFTSFSRRLNKSHQSRLDQVYKYALFKKLDEWKQRAIAAEGEQHFAVMDHDDVVSQIKQLEVDNKIFVDHVTKLKKRFNELEAQITSNESTIKFVSKYVGYRGSDPSKAPIPPECGGAMKRFKYDGGKQCNLYDAEEEDQDTDDVEVVPNTPYIFPSHEPCQYCNEKNEKNTISHKKQSWKWDKYTNH